jgi:ribonuclease HII
MKKKPNQNLQNIADTAKKRAGRVSWMIGIDEVGRGPVAGPVTVCAFAVRTKFVNDINQMGFRDSKKLSSQKRESSVHILNNCRELDMCKWVIHSISAEVIDKQGLSYAIRTALQTCLKKLDIHAADADVYLDGGLHAPKSYFRQHTVIHGDDLFPVISCASIIAKVYRDRLMDKFDLQYPNYGFITNKGYGTAEHIKAIKKQGTTPIHRESFLTGIIKKKPLK